MSQVLRDIRIGVLERRHPPGYQGALIDQLAPRLREAGAHVEIVHAEEGLHRLDSRPPWDIVVLKSGAAPALHLAAAAERWGVPCVNTSDATRLAQDKLASTAILQRAGLPIAPAQLLWIDGAIDRAALRDSGMALSHGREVVLKAARGSLGKGVWRAMTHELPALAARLPPGPYLIMAYVPHHGDDLKIFAAGSWHAAIERPFPATTLDQKRGRPVAAPAAVIDVTHRVGQLLGLSCFGCDFVRGADGWVLVDVNAFPGYKGATGAAEAIVAEIVRVARGATR